jgi:hypothetical protein
MHATIFQLLRVIELASAAEPDLAALADEPGATVRPGRAGGLDLVELTGNGDTGPTLPALEKALGPSSSVPRVPGLRRTIVAFAPRGRIAVYAYLDDTSGRAAELLVRRDY